MMVYLPAVPVSAPSVVSPGTKTFATELTHALCNIVVTRATELTRTLWYGTITNTCNSDDA